VANVASKCDIYLDDIYLDDIYLDDTSKCDLTA